MNRNNDHDIKTTAKRKEVIITVRIRRIMVMALEIMVVSAGNNDKY